MTVDLAELERLLEDGCWCVTELSGLVTLCVGCEKFAERSRQALPALFELAYAADEAVIAEQLPRASDATNAEVKRRAHRLYAALAAIRFPDETTPSTPEESPA